MQNYKTVLEQLKPFVIKVSHKREEKAVNDISRAMAGAILESGISLDVYLNDFKNDNIFDPSCLVKNTKNIFESVTPKYRDFAKILFCLRPVGLGTPNAMVGEGEVLALFTSPRVGIAKKSGTGDITVDGKNVELKGSGVRVYSQKSGVVFAKEVAEISKRYDIEPNDVNKGRKAFEPWESSKKKNQHWIQQFAKLGEKKSKKYLFEVMNATGSEFSEESIERVFKNGFSVQQLEKEIIKSFFKSTQKKWDAFTVINNGSIVSITHDCDEFDKMVEEGIIKPEANFFRMFQSNPLGWYVKF
jgi:hypothetical protein